jgi:hypothetical protein
MLAAVRIRPFGLVVSVTAITVVAVLIGSVSVWRATAAVDTNESMFVPVTPARILDTRDPIDVGLAGPFVSPTSQKLRVTGAVPTTDGTRTVVPAGATGVVLNVTVALPTAAGFVSVRPGDATGPPATSSLNFEAGVVQPNAVTVELPTSGPNAGMIDITYDAYGSVGPITDVFVDVVGFTTNTGIQSLVADLAAKANRVDVYTKNQTDTALATKANSVDVYTTGQTDAALATKADIDQVRAAMIADRVWVARVSGNGAKSGTGPFTSTRVETGHYSVSFNVADFDLPLTDQSPRLTITTSCVGHTASVGFAFVSSTTVNMTSFGASYFVRDHNNTAKDCAASIHVKFSDPDTGSPIGTLSTERAATPPPIPESATCTTDGDTTTCTVDAEEPRDDARTAGP